MALRDAVPKTLPGSPVPPRSPTHQPRLLPTPSESALPQLLILPDFNSFISNAYEKPGEVPRLQPPKFVDSSPILYASLRPISGTPPHPMFVIPSAARNLLFPPRPSPLLHATSQSVQTQRFHNAQFRRTLSPLSATLTKNEGSQVPTLYFVIPSKARNLLLLPAVRSFDFKVRRSTSSGWHRLQFVRLNGNRLGAAGGASAIASNSGKRSRSGSGTFTLELFSMLISCSALTTPFP
jgi:hypothetical protein